jgi:A/G-specific adenine glycosylase
MWQGLGYYSRARNLLHAARQIVKEFKGKFPSEYSDIRSLKGVGEYTAAAIASFAFDQEYPVVDGNVFRLLSRYFGIKTPIDTSKGKKEFTALAGELIKNFPPAIFNQAIMEFGAKQCRPANPACMDCPLHGGCYALKHDVIRKYPFRQNKTKVKKRYFHYLVIRTKGSFYIKRRNEKDIWQGLHDFPLIETEKKINETTLIGSSEWKKTFSRQKIKLLSVSPEYTHVLSHQHIHAIFYEISAENIIGSNNVKEWKKVNSKSVKKFAVPRLIENYLASVNLESKTLKAI